MTRLNAMPPFSDWRHSSIRHHMSELNFEHSTHSKNFSIPQWLPSTIEPLCIAASISKNCASKVSAQKALREFKRTHQDQWEEHKEKVIICVC